MSATSGDDGGGDCELQPAATSRSMTHLVVVVVVVVVVVGRFAAVDCRSEWSALDSLAPRSRLRQGERQLAAAVVVVAAGAGQKVQVRR